MRLLAAASLMATLAAMPAWSQAPNPAGMKTRHARDRSRRARAQSAEPAGPHVHPGGRDGRTGEVDLGQLAEQQGQNSAIQNFARRMVQDHGKANEQLAQLAQAAHVPLPSGPDAASKAMHARLASLQDGEFDRASPPPPANQVPAAGGANDTVR